MEEESPMGCVDICNFFLPRIVFCLISRNSSTHCKKNLFLSFARKGSQEMTGALFFHRRGVDNCLKLNLGLLIIQLGSWA